MTYIVTGVDVLVPFFQKADNGIQVSFAGCLNECCVCVSVCACMHVCVCGWVDGEG